MECTKLAVVKMSHKIFFNDKVNLIETWIKCLKDLYKMKQKSNCTFYAFKWPEGKELDKSCGSKYAFQCCFLALEIEIEARFFTNEH